MPSVQRDRSSSKRCPFFLYFAIQFVYTPDVVSVLGSLQLTNVPKNKQATEELMKWEKRVCSI